MAEFEEFSFVIPAYTPETMPLDRLIEYLQQISAVIGDAANLHLIKIDKSSTAPTFIVPKRAALQAKERAAQFNRGDGTREQARAYNRLRRMVRRDAPEARRPAVLSSAAKVILEIPAAPEDSGALTGIRQASTFDGVLVSIGGVGDAASVRLQTLDGQVVSGFTATRTVAKDLAKLIYEPIRVSGPGIWGRSEEGVWGLERMQIQSFEPLDDEPLREVLARLRSVEVEWPADTFERLRLEREGAA
jgi:hypothetical protein